MTSALKHLRWGRGMKKRILVVDDSNVVLAMASNALQASGYEVFTAVNGIEANGYLFRQDPPDAIVLDIMIPLLKGDKVAKLIKQNRHIKDIPILLISSKPEEELGKMAVDSGADGVLQKPFTGVGLVQKVEEVMRSRR